MRLDVTLITGTRVTLTAPARCIGRRNHARADARPDGAPGELWIVIGAPLDRSDLADKLAMSERVFATGPPMPSSRDARSSRPRRQGGKSAQSPCARPGSVSAPPRCHLVILEQARAADPGAIEPLLAMAKAARTD